MTSTTVPGTSGHAEYARAMVEAAVDAGAFGQGCRLVRFELDGRHDGQDQFASTVLYGTVTVADEPHGSPPRGTRLVMKLKHRSAALRHLFQNDKQFHNETLFYERIAPFLLDRARPSVRVPPLCRYLYGRNDCGDRVLDDGIVLENVTARGYHTSDQMVRLDFDHLLVALRTLAKFHALSYIAKQSDPIKFAETVGGIREAHFQEDGQWHFESCIVAGLISMALDRLAERRGSAGECDGSRRMRTEFLDDPTAALRRVMRPAEPLAVLCHGDFNRNNLVFRYDEGARPVDALPFDMGTVRYASPALDLSFFLYMNTDRETRDRHWDALLDEYCAALSDAAPAVRVPDRAQLDAEMRDRAFYALPHVSFFVRMVMCEQCDPQAFYNMDTDARFHYIASLGGDRATDVIADVVQHFIDLTYSHD